MAETKPAIQNIEAKLKASMKEKISQNLIKRLRKMRNQRSVYFNKQILKNLTN